jgi:hypothetical protein
VDDEKKQIERAVCIYSDANYVYNVGGKKRGQSAQGQTQYYFQYEKWGNATEDWYAHVCALNHQQYESLCEQARTAYRKSRKSGFADGKTNSDYRR